MAYTKIAACALAGVVLIAAITAAAQPYPAKPIKIINAFSPGGSSDTLARTIGQPLGERLGQPVVVESRAGAGGNIGAEAVAKAAPDGYTLLMGTSTFPVAMHLYRKLNYDFVRDLAPVTLIGGTLMVLVAHPTLSAKSIAELVELARAKPNEIAYATPGLGTLTHLDMELFAAQMGIQLRHIPYRSNPLAMNDVVAGHVPLLLDFVTTGVPHIKSGKVRALATTGLTRAAALPEVPTMHEAGVTNYEARAWFGLFVTAGTPQEIIARLHNEVAAILATPSVRERLTTLGIELGVGDAATLGALVRTEIERRGRIIERANIPKLD